MEYTFTGSFEGIEKTVRITRPFGAGANNFYLMIDNFYCGAINKMSDGWHVYFNEGGYTADDERMILDILFEQLLKEPLL